MLLNGIETVRLQGTHWVGCHVALQDGHDPMGARGGMYSIECDIPPLGHVLEQLVSRREAVVGPLRGRGYLEEVGH